MSRRAVQNSVLLVLLPLLGLGSGCGTDVPHSVDADAADARVDSNLATDAVQVSWDGATAVIALPSLQSGSDGLSPLLSLPGSELASRGVFSAETEPGVQLAVARWEGPGGLALVVPSWLLGSDAPWLCTSGCVVRLATEPGAIAAPWRPSAADGREHRVGLYAFRWQDGSAVPAAVEIQPRWVLQQGEIPSQGVLRLNICLTGALGWTAKLAPQLERLQTALAFATERYAAVGISLDVHYLDLVAPNVLVEHDVADLELAAIWQAGAALPMGVNVVLVERIYRQTTSGPQSIAGLSGGIPGVPLAVGGPRGGVALSLALQPGQVDRLGPVLAHELGHFLGLFHSTEAPPASGPQLHDPLDDTAENDPTNLMYWSPTENSVGLSPQQGQILRGSPWIVPAP